MMKFFVKVKETKTTSFLPRRQIKIPCERGGQSFIWNLEDFEREMELRYLFHLEFASPRIEKKILQRCKKAKEEGMIGSQELWLGALYEKEIVEGIVAEVGLRWLGPQMGYGLFAEKDFPAKSYIGEYVGRVRPFSKRKDDKNSYCFEYITQIQKKTHFTIDARDQGNLIRFINHSSSCNLTPHLAYCENILHVILLTNQPVAKGNEFTYDYGPTYWSKREKPQER